MATIESPTNPMNILQVDRSFLAARSSSKPWDWINDNGSIIGGHFRAKLVTGLTTGIAADGAILSLRWTTATHRFLLLRMRAYATITTAFGTGQENSLNLVKLTNYTAADTGGTTHSIATLPRKLNQGMQSSQLTAVSVATTAALTPGTASADTLNVSFAAMAMANTVGFCAGEDLFDVQNAECPVILNSLEGLRVTLGIAQGATGVVRFTIVMDWAEVPNT